MTDPAEPKLAVIVIGRNEGGRLIDCFQTIPTSCKVVYVDSGSVDESVQAAKGRADLIIQLDDKRPFTAARARNEGAFSAIDAWPNIEYLQFIDGDCLLEPNWIDDAVTFLIEHQAVAAVCGRRRERFPDRSIYNQLCDLEWNSPIGNAKACGGDAMIRVVPFRQVNGYQSDLIAGEEPEMCARMREAGWIIWRLDAAMTKHDAAMLRFSQWWRRAVRSGYAELDVYLRSRRRRSSVIDERRQVFRSLFWGIIYPLFVAVLVEVFSWQALAALGLYVIQIARIGFRRKPFALISWTYAILVMAAKFAGAWGMFLYLWRRAWAKPATLIEYKGA